MLKLPRQNKRLEEVHPIREPDIETKEEDNFKRIDHVSDVLELISDISALRNVINIVKINSTDAEGISAAAEQLSASIKEVADHAVQVAEYSDHVVEDVELGCREIEGRLREILALGELFTNMREKVDSLSMATQKISQVAHFIRTIADQTNLLALNAAIEAARAGEHGRGFSVVAAEVRSLADKTKESIHQITDTIEQVQQESQWVWDHTHQVVNELHIRVKQSQEAIQHLEGIVDKVAQTREFTSHIAANTEEQAAATEEITNRISHMLDHALYTKEQLDKMVRQMKQTGDKVNHLRLDLIQQTSQWDDHQLVRIVKTDHLLWKWWLYNMLLGYHSVDEKQLVDHHQCRLGQWYDQARNRADLVSLDSFRAIDEPHQKVHLLAKEIYRLNKAKQHTEAENRLLELEQVSQQVVEKLDRLSSELQ